MYYQCKMNPLFFFTFCFIVGFGIVLASPKKYVPETEEGGFKPSSRYYESSLPSYTGPFNVSKVEEKEAKDADRVSRFGISSFAGTGNGVQGGYPGNGMSYMINPMKIDIGGIVLGALIGLGTVLIIPKLTQALASGYGYRSIENDMSAITDALQRIDSSLEQHNIDSSSCMQRIICTYVNGAKNNMENGEANTMDQLIYTISNNSLFTYMLDGTAIKEAVDIGKKGDMEKCSSMFLKCPVTRDNVLKVVSSLLPA